MKPLFEGLLPLYDAFELFVANEDLEEVDDCHDRIVSESLKISHEFWLAQALGLQEMDVRPGVQFTVWVATQDGIRHCLRQVGSTYLNRMCPKRHKKKEEPMDTEENKTLVKSPPPKKSSRRENQTLVH